jgi:hypothetical protein
MSAPKKIPVSGLPRGELEALAERLLVENAALRQAIAELRAEVATHNLSLRSMGTFGQARRGRGVDFVAFFAPTMRFKHQNL